MRCPPVAIGALMLVTAGYARADNGSQEPTTCEVRRVAPSPDGRWLAVGFRPGAARTALCVVDAATGRLAYAWVPTGPAELEPTGMIEWSADSAALVGVASRPPALEGRPRGGLESVYRDLYWIVERDEKLGWMQRELRSASAAEAPAGFTFLFPGKGGAVLGAARQPDGSRELIWFNAGTGATTSRAGQLPAYYDIRHPRVRQGTVYFLADEAIMPEALRTTPERWPEALGWAGGHAARWRWRSLALVSGAGQAYGEPVDRYLAADVSADCRYGAILRARGSGLAWGELRVTPLEAGAAEESVVAPQAEGPAGLAWAPRADRLLLYPRPGAGGAWVVEPHTTEARRFLEGRELSAAAWSADGSGVYFAERGVVWFAGLTGEAPTRVLDAHGMAKSGDIKIRGHNTYLLTLACGGWYAWPHGTNGKGTTPRGRSPRHTARRAVDADLRH